ncbi:FxsA family protein [Litchfieldella xinjiangensis]|uniref:FxsA family protein n=1 Tax=Litchfieldella xinjiangensis TaxID=1166948 RepID=UPI0005B9E996|nr:FxsA family protein [Halomonas xinjiangensis]
MPFLLIFTVFALLDFVVLFSVGSHIGLLTTLLMVLATGFIGLHLVRREGVATFQRAQQRLAQGELPSQELLTGAALIFGGALLMAPGFLSDTLGFLCLIPTSRRLLGKWLTRASLKLKGFEYRQYDFNARQSPRPERADNPQDPETSRSREEPGQSRGDKPPLEGDFISRDEPHR